MEENVALDSSRQKDFVKSVKGIKKLINKEKAKGDSEEKGVLKAVKHGKITKRKPKRGLVYLSHIPHGFYEHQMTQYFRQFGMVTNARVIRSPRTGNSKGYAFVEFKDPTVAQVVAETMNNYLMGKRLIKALYIPPEKQRTHAKRKHWTFENNPTANRRKENKKTFNATKTEKQDLQSARTMLKNLNKNKQKLKEMGIDYDFFTPVDVPEGLEIQTKTEAQDVKDIKIKKEDKIDVDKVKVEDKKLNVVKKENKDTKSKSKTKKEEKPVVKEAKTKKESKVKVDTKMQKEKKQKLKDSNVKLLEDFITVQESDGDSDGSLEFDSEEFEKAMGIEDSLEDEELDSEDVDLSDEITSDEDEPAEPVKIVQSKKKKDKVVPQATVKKGKKPAQPTISKKKAETKSTPKIPKFEKQSNKKTLNKVIKKKK